MHVHVCRVQISVLLIATPTTTTRWIDAWRSFPHKVHAIYCILKQGLVEIVERGFNHRHHCEGKRRAQMGC